MSQEIRRRSRAAVQLGPASLELQHLDVGPVGPLGGLLRVEACGICGTDIDQFLDRHGNRDCPLVLGHEAVGRIEELGEQAARRWGVAVGDRVAVEVMLPCGGCRQCRTGQSRICPTRRADRRAYSTIPLSVPPGLWGAFADYLYLDQSSVLHRVPDELPAPVAVMFNSAANAIEWCLLTPGTRIGDDVVVLGCGQRALMSIIALRAAGARRIVVTGLTDDAYKLDLARELGADAAVDVQTGDLVATVRAVTGGRMADVVVDMTPGATEAIATAMDVARDGATIVLAGIKGGRSSAFDSDRFVTRGLSLRSGLSAGYEAYERAIDLLTAKASTFARLHSRTFPLEDAAEAIRTLAGQAGNRAICVSLTIGETPAE